MRQSYRKLNTQNTKTKGELAELRMMLQLQGIDVDELKQQYQAKVKVEEEEEDREKFGVGFSGNNLGKGQKEEGGSGLTRGAIWGGYLCVSLA